MRWMSLRSKGVMKLVFHLVGDLVSRVLDGKDSLCLPLHVLEVFEEREELLRAGQRFLGLLLEQGLRSLPDSEAA